MIIKYFATIICFFITLKSEASSVYVGMRSHHFNFNQYCDKKNKCFGNDKPNSNHNLFMYEYKSYEVGTFVNSYYDKTYLLAKKIRVDAPIINNVYLSFHVGATYGYHDCIYNSNYSSKKKTCFMFSPEIAYTKYKLEPILLLFGSGIAISARYKF